MLNQQTSVEHSRCQQSGKRIVYPELNLAITSTLLKNGQICNHVELLRPPSKVLKVTRKPKRLTSRHKIA